MSLLRLDGHAPLVRNILFDPEEFVGRLLLLIYEHFRGERRAQVMVAAAEVENASQLSLKALQMAPSLIGSDLNTFWTIAAQQDDVTDILNRIYRHLARIWIQELPIQGLSPDSNFLDESADLAEHEQKIASILRRLGGVQIVLVTDLTNWRSNADAVLGYLEFARRISDGVLSRNIIFVTVVDVEQLDRLPDDLETIKAPAVPKAFEKALLELASKSAPSAAERIGSGTEHVDFARILAPWYAFGRPLRTPQSQLLAEDLPSAEEVLETLLRDHLVYPLIKNSYSMTPEGASTAAQTLAIEERKARPTADIVPNALKILEFLPRRQLVAVRSSVEDLMAANPSPSTILRMVAAVLAPNSDSARWQKDLLETLSRPTLVREEAELFQNRSYARIAINYLGQSLLLGDAELTTEHFKVFETLSYLYADTLVNEPEPDPDKLMEASGWVYNIGYVYVRAGLGSGSAGGRRAKKMQTDITALFALQKINKAPPRTMFEANFQKGLYLYNTESFEKSARTFLDQVDQCLDASDVVIERNEAFSITPRDFIPAFFSNALRSAQLCAPSARRWIIDDLRRCDRTVADALGFSILEEIMVERDGQFECREVLDVWCPNAARPPDVVVVGHTGAAAENAFVASEIFRELNVSVRCYSISSAARFHEVEASTPQPLIVCGGPESRFGLGDFICELDPSIKHLFQFISAGPVGLPVEVIDRRHPRVVFATWSIGDAVRAVRRWIANEKERKGPMDTIFQDIASSPLVSGLTNRVSAALVNRLADVVTAAVAKKLKAAKGAAAVDTENVRARIEPILASRAEAASHRDSADTLEAIGKALSGSDSMEKRAIAEVVATDEWVIVLEDVLSQLRTADVSVAELISSLHLLLEISAQQIEALGRDEEKRMDAMSQQAAFREFLLEAREVQRRERTRAVRNNEAVSDLMTRVFTSASYYLETLRRA